MSSLTKTLTFNSKEELDKWLKENEGKINYIVRDASGQKLKEGKKSQGEGVLGWAGDLLQDMFIRPVQVAGVGLVEGFGNLIGNEGIKTAARNYARENLPVSWLQDYEKDPLKTTFWNTLDTALTYGTLGAGGAITKGAKLLGNAGKWLKGLNLLDKATDTAKAVNIAGKLNPVVKFANSADDLVKPITKPIIRALPAPDMEVMAGTATMKIPFKQNPQLYRYYEARKKFEAEQEAINKIPKLPFDKVKISDGLVRVFGSTREAMEFLKGLENVKRSLGLIKDVPEKVVKEVVKQTPVKKVRMLDEILPDLMKNASFKKPSVDIKALADEKVLKKIKELENMDKFGAKDVKEFFDTIRNSIPRVSVNPIVKNTGLGLLSYELSTPSEDKNLGGAIFAGALGGGLPVATNFVGKHIVPRVFKTAEPAPFYGSSKLSGNSIKELSLKDVTGVMKRAVVNKGDNVLQADYSNVSGHPEYKFGDTLVDKLRQLGLWFMWSPDKKEKYPTRDLDFAKSVLANMYTTLESVLGKPVQINARNNETIKKAMEMARREAAELANVKGPIQGTELVDRFRGFFDEARLREEASQLARLSGKPPTDDIINQITEELYKKNAAKMVATLPFASRTSNLSKVAAAMEKGEPVEFITLDKAIREINDALETYKSRKPSFREKGELSIAETVKDILKEYQEKYIPNISEWDKAFVALNKFISKPGSGSVKEATWYWGSLPAILRSMGKPVADFAANSLMWAGAQTSASKRKGAALNKAAENFLTKISSKNAYPYMAGAYPGYAENTKDRLVGSAISPSMELTKKLLDNRERAIEEETMRQAQNYISQRKQELMQLRNQIFENALASGQSITNAQKLADFYVENQLKELERLQKGARETVEEQKNRTRAHLGLRGVETLKELTKDPATVNFITMTHALTPGFLNIVRPPEVQLFEQAGLQVSEAMSRILSGTAIKEDEMERFIRLLPRFGDTKETLDYKLNALESFFNEAISANTRVRQSEDILNSIGVDRDVLLENKDIILDNIK